MALKDLQIASELRRRVAEVAQVVSFKVFGSRARGDADECSDLDVFIVVESLNRQLKDRIIDIVWEVGFENYMVISPLIVTRDEIENTPLRSSSIIERIAEEGVAV